MRRLVKIKVRKVESNSYFALQHKVHLFDLHVLAVNMSVLLIYSRKKSRNESLGNQGYNILIVIFLAEAAIGCVEKPREFQEHVCKQIVHIQLLLYLLWNRSQKHVVWVVEILVAVVDDEVVQICEYDLLQRGSNHIMALVESLQADKPVLELSLSVWIFLLL